MFVEGRAGKPRRGPPRPPPRNAQLDAKQPHGSRGAEVGRVVQCDGGGAGDAWRHSLIPKRPAKSRSLDGSAASSRSISATSRTVGLVYQIQCRPPATPKHPWAPPPPLRGGNDFKRAGGGTKATTNPIIVDVELIGEVARHDPGGGKRPFFDRRQSPNILLSSGAHLASYPLPWTLPRL